MSRRQARGRLMIIVMAVSMLGAAYVPRASAVGDDAGQGTGEKRPAERVLPAPEVNPEAVVWRTPEPPKDPQAGDVWLNPKDGMEMVWVPPGEFLLGTSKEEIDAWVQDYPAYRKGRDDLDPFENERPQCRVNLAGYWIGRTEATNAQYLRFVQATGRGAPKHWKGGKVPSGMESFPVVTVNWDDASAYCKWAGGKLPTELEWEKAARGTDGRTFPWGNQWDSGRCRNSAYITDITDLSDWKNAVSEWMLARGAPGFSVAGGRVAVGSYPPGASPYGCLDMAGNVWEWCGSEWDWNYERHAKGDLRPPRGDPYSENVIRGGSWDCTDPWDFRCAHRWWQSGEIRGVPVFTPVFRPNPTTKKVAGTVGGSDTSLGFRCARAPG